VRQHKHIHAPERRGQSTTEFVLIIPLLLLLMVGLLDLARLMWAYESLGHAVREGTRYAIVHGASSSLPADQAAIRDVIVSTARPQNADDLVVSLTFDPDNHPGSKVSVEARYAFRPASTFFTSAVSLELVSRSTMIISR